MIKAIRTISAMEGIFSTIGATSGSVNNTRKSALTTIIKNITIDTCLAFDTNTWETGIKKNNEWVIVEQYSSEEKAKNGHKKWEKNITKNSDLKLNDINVWDI